MNITLLYNVIHTNTKLTRKESEELANKILSKMKESLENGEGIQFRNVFSINPKLHNKRWITNLKTGKPELLPARYRYKLHVPDGITEQMNKTKKG